MQARMPPGFSGEALCGFWDHPGATLPDGRVFCPSGAAPKMRSEDATGGKLSNYRPQTAS